MFQQHPRHVAGPQRISIPGDPQDRWISITWRFLAGSFGLLAGMAILVVLTGAAQPLGGVVVGLVAIVGGAAWLHRQAVVRLDTSRRTEAESFARMFQGLARSISPEAIIEAMVGDLGRVTAADHCVVVHLERDTGALERDPRVDAPRCADDHLGPAADRPAARAGEPRRPGPGPAGRCRRGVLRDRQHPDRAPPPRAVGDRRDHPLAAQPGALAGRDPADPGRRGDRSGRRPRPRRHSRAMAARATTDALTGLPNRRYFDEFCSLLGRRRRSDDDARRSAS